MNDDYPVQFSVDYGDGTRNRLTTLFRIIMIIPIAIVSAILTLPLTRHLRVGCVLARRPGTADLDSVAWFRHFHDGPVSQEISSLGLQFPA